jgi:hypothetical protein
MATRQTASGPSKRPRPAEVFRWALPHSVRVVQVLRLGTLGLSYEPRGTYLPSILY